MIILLSSLMSGTILAVDSPNAEITGPSFDELTFLSASEKGFTIISGGVNLGKKTWYLDENKNSSFYFQGFSGEISLGIPYKTSKGKICLVQTYIYLNSDMMENILILEFHLDLILNSYQSISTKFIKI